MGKINGYRFPPEQGLRLVSLQLHIVTLSSCFIAADARWCSELSDH